ncbi:MAG: T9SS type A sorting domain-containing protein, partial [Bacteroidales bacterium]|nr:T9SS type A sorting domain-containing protein [Bacteroidales bacterium]
IEVGNGKVLTIKGNVNSAGEFKGKGTVEFSDGDHTVAGTGSFVNLTNSGTVTAANDIAVNGTLNNTGEFVGDGVVSMSGAKLEGEGSFNNITFNNNVDVVGNTTIYGKMVMNGVVTAQNQINIGEEGSMSGSSWVNGKVQKKWRDADMGYFDFKIGSIAHAAPVRVTPTSEGAEFTASYAYDGSKPAITDKELIGDLERVSAQETWNIDGNVPSLITLYWSDFSGVTTDDELYIAHKLSNGTWEKLDGEVLDNSITTRTPVSSYSPFTFGAKNPEPDINPLPVTFAAFTGRQDGNSVALEWTTLSEKDNDYFEIERSIDGVNYVTVGYVDGAGNSSKRIDYTFSDNAPEQGLLYYRLSQVDFDGTREYADKVVTVYYTGGELGNLVVVPNPTNGLFRVSASGSMAGGRIELLSQSGMVIRIIDISSFDATIDISDLPSGIYVLRFVTDTKVLQQKVVKY